MARTAEQVIKDQFGNLLTEVAILTSRVELLLEENERLKKQLESKGEEK